jgi:hypothetical protein
LSPRITAVPFLRGNGEAVAMSLAFEQGPESGRRTAHDDQQNPLSAGCREGLSPGKEYGISSDSGG